LLRQPLDHHRQRHRGSASMRAVRSSALIQASRARFVLTSVDGITVCEPYHDCTHRSSYNGADETGNDRDPRRL
jgi:hypothetical protein